MCGSLIHVVLEWIGVDQMNRNLFWYSLFWFNNAETIYFFPPIASTKHLNHFRANVASTTCLAVNCFVSQGLTERVKFTSFTPLCRSLTLMTYLLAFVKRKLTDIFSILVTLLEPLHVRANVSQLEFWILL